MSGSDGGSEDAVVTEGVVVLVSDSTVVRCDAVVNPGTDGSEVVSDVDGTPTVVSGTLTVDVATVVAGLSVVSVVTLLSFSSVVGVMGEEVRKTSGTEDVP